MATNIKKVIGSLKRVQLADIDAEMGRLKAELVQLQKLRDLIGAGPNGQAGPEAANGRPTMAGPVRQRVRAYLETAKKPASATEIAAAIGEDRAAVYQALKKDSQQEFKLVADGWKLR